MRRIVAFLLLAIFVLGASGLQRPASAQSADGSEQQKKAEEFTDLWQRLSQPRDAGERIALAERALALERELGQWPFGIERAEARARLSFALGVGLDEWRGGDKAENLERAIAAYFEALQVFTSKRFSIDWAALQNNLAGAYYNRIRGDRADNLERAIAHLEAALTVFTHEALPQERALTQNNLSAAYRYRIRGDRARNLERATAHLEAALNVFTRETLPRPWATPRRLPPLRQP